MSQEGPMPPALGVKLQMMRMQPATTSEVLAIGEPTTGALEWQVRMQSKAEEMVPPIDEETMAGLG